MVNRIQRFDPQSGTLVIAPLPPFAIGSNYVFDWSLRRSKRHDDKIGTVRSYLGLLPDFTNPVFRNCLEAAIKRGRHVASEWKLVKAKSLTDLAGIRYFWLQTSRRRSKNTAKHFAIRAQIDRIEGKRLRFVSHYRNDHTSMVSEPQVLRAACLSS